MDGTVEAGWGMPGAELQRLVDVLAERLGRSVAIDDPAIRLIVASRHFGDEDQVRVRAVLNREADRPVAEWALAQGIGSATGLARLPANPELDTRSRLCFPIRFRGLLLGYLWLIDAGASISADQLTDAAQTAAAAGAMLYRDDFAQKRRRTREQSLLRGLLSSEARARTRAAEELAEAQIGQPAAFVAVAVGEVACADDGVGMDELETSLGLATERVVQTQTAGALLGVVEGGRATLLLASARCPTETELAALGQRLLFEVAGQRPGPRPSRCVVGLGSAHEGLEHALHSHDQARLAARATRLLPGLGDVVTWSALGVYALLVKLGPEHLAPADYPAPVLRLFDSEAAETLVPTLETYLDCAGDAQRTAQQLHIHRSTLYHRLARIEQVTGLDLHDGSDRLTLHLSTKLTRLGAPPVPPQQP